MSYTPDYLYYISKNYNATLTFYKHGNSSDSIILEYSNDKHNWTSLNLTNDNQSNPVSITLTANIPMYFRGSNNTIGSSSSIYLNLQATAATANDPEIWCGGSIGTLLDYTQDVINIPAYCFYKFFSGDTLIRKAPNIDVMAVQDHGCSSMFEGCTALDIAPDLSATTLNSYCYSHMFSGCTSLIVAPTLSESLSTIGSYALEYMFSNCTNLKSPTSIKADFVFQCAFQRMYYYCRGLTALPSISISQYIASYTCYRMFEGCSHLDISATQTETSTYSFVMPSASGSDAYFEMFYNTGDSVITPTAGTTYYTTKPMNIAGDDTDYFYIQNIDKDGNSVKVQMYFATGPSAGLTFYYSINNRANWQQQRVTSYGDWGTYTMATLAPGEVVYIYGLNNSTDITVRGQYAFHLVQASGATALAPTVARGDLTKLWNKDATIINSQVYTYYFASQTSLVLPPKINATSIGKYSFYYTFSNCTNLLIAPELPATTLTQYCYQRMFNGCTGLLVAPYILPAETLPSKGYAYYDMFNSCSALRNAPEIAANSVDSEDGTVGNFAGMFYDCSSLLYPPSELSLPSVGGNEYREMFYGCANLLTVPIIKATTNRYMSTVATSPPFGYMFYNCSSLTQVAALMLTFYYNEACEHMFDGCSNLKITDTLDSTQKYMYRIPFSGTGSVQPQYTRHFSCMFDNTASTIISPTVNTTYYSNLPVIADMSLADAINTSSTTGREIHRTITSCAYPSGSYIKATATCGSVTDSVEATYSSVPMNIDITGPFPSRISGSAATYTVVYEVYTDSTKAVLLGTHTVYGTIPIPTQPVFSQTTTAFTVTASLTAPSLSANYKVTFNCNNTDYETTWATSGNTNYTFTGLSPNTNYTITYYVYDSDKTKDDAFYTGQLISTTNPLATLTSVIESAHVGYFTFTLDSAITDTYYVQFALLIDGTAYAATSRQSTFSGGITWSATNCIPKLASGTHTYQIGAIVYDSSSATTPVATLLESYTPIAYTLTLDTTSASGRYISPEFIQGDYTQAHTITTSGPYTTTVTTTAGTEGVTLSGTCAQYGATYTLHCDVTYTVNSVAYTILSADYSVTSQAAASFQSIQAYQNKLDIALQDLVATQGAYDYKYVTYQWELASGSLIIGSHQVEIDSTATNPGFYTITGLIPDQTYTILWTLYAADGTTILQEQRSNNQHTGEFGISSFTYTADYTSVDTTITYTINDADELSNFSVDYICDGTTTTKTLTSVSSDTQTFSNLTINTSYTITANVYYTYDGTRYLIKTATCSATTKKPADLSTDLTSSSIALYTTTNNYYSAIATASWTLKQGQTTIATATSTFNSSDIKIGYVIFTDLDPVTQYDYTVNYFSSTGLAIGSDEGSITTPAISANFNQLAPYIYNAITVQITNIDYAASGLYVEYVRGAYTSGKLPVSNGAAASYTFTGLNAGTYYTTYARVYRSASATGYIAQFQVTAETSHIATVITEASTYEASLWLSPTDLQISSGYVTWTLKLNGRTIATKSATLDSTAAQPAKVTFTGLSRNTTYSYEAEVCNQEETPRIIIDTIDGHVTTLNYTGTLTYSVDFNTIALSLTNINFNINTMTLIYHCGDNVWSSVQSSTVPDSHTFTNLSYNTSYDCYAEVSDNGTTILTTSHKNIRTTQPIIFTINPYHQSAQFAITSCKSTVSTITWSFNGGADTTYSATTQVISGFLPNTPYTYSAQCKTGGGVAEGNPITGSFTTQAVGGIVSASLITNESATLSVTGFNIIETGTYKVTYTCNGQSATYTFTNTGIASHAVTGLTGNTTYPVTVTVTDNNNVTLVTYTGSFTTERDWKQTFSYTTPHDIIINPTYYPAAYANYYYDTTLYYNGTAMGTTGRISFANTSTLTNLIPKISGTFTYSTYVYDAATGGNLIDSLVNATYTPQAYTIYYTANASEYVNFTLSGFPANYTQTVNITIKKSGTTVKTDTLTIAAADTSVTCNYTDLYYGSYSISYEVVWSSYTVASATQSYKSSILPITYSITSTDDTVTATIGSMSSQVTKVSVICNSETIELTEAGAAVFDELTASTSYSITINVYHDTTLLDRITTSIMTKANGGYINVSNLEYDSVSLLLMNPKLSHSDDLTNYTVTYYGSMGTTVTVPIDYITRGEAQIYTGLTANTIYNAYADLKYGNTLVAHFSKEFTTPNLYTLTTSSTATTATAVFDSMPFTRKMAVSATLNGTTYTWTRNIGDYSEAFTPVWTELARNTDYTLSYTISVDDTVVESGTRTIHTLLYDYTLIYEWEASQLKTAVNNLTANVDSIVVFTITRQDGSIYTQTVEAPARAEQTYTGWVLPTNSVVDKTFTISAAITENGTTYTLTATTSCANPYACVIEQYHDKITAEVQSLDPTLSTYSVIMDIKDKYNTISIDQVSYTVPTGTIDTGRIANHSSVTLVPGTTYSVTVTVYLNGSYPIAFTKLIAYNIPFDWDAYYTNNALYANVNWYSVYTGYYMTITLVGGAAQTQSLSYGTGQSFSWSSVDQTVNQTLNLAFYNPQGQLIAQSSKTVKPQSEYAVVYAEIADDDGNINCYVAPVPSAVTGITWTVYQSGAVVAQKYQEITATDHQTSPIYTWTATSNTTYNIYCVFSDGTTYHKTLTTPAFGYNLSDIEIVTATSSTTISFSLENCNTNLTYKYGVYRDGTAIGDLHDITVTSGGYSGGNIISGLAPHTTYDLYIYCYDRGNLIGSIKKQVTTNYRAYLAAQWSAYGIDVWLDNMDYETGSVTYRCGAVSSAAMPFTDAQYGAYASLAVNHAVQQTVYADVTYTTNGTAYYETLQATLDSELDAEIMYRINLDNTQYPVLTLLSTFDSSYIINYQVYLRSGDTNVWDKSGTLNPRATISDSTALTPGDYILSWKVWNGTTNQVLLEGNKSFTAYGVTMEPILVGEGYGDKVYAYVGNLEYDKIYHVTYSLVGTNVTQTIGPLTIMECYFSEDSVFTNVTEEAPYLLEATYTIGSDTTVYHLSTQVIWDQTASSYGNDQLKIIPSIFNTSTLVAEATGTYIDESTDYSLHWQLYTNGSLIRESTIERDANQPHPYITFNNLSLDKRYDIILDYTGTVGSNTYMTSTRRRTYSYLGSVGTFTYFETDSKLYITYNAESQCYANVTLTSANTSPLITSIDSGNTIELTNVKPNTTYNVEAIITHDTTRAKLGEINETYTTLNWLKISATESASLAITVTVEKMRFGISSAYVKFNIRNAGATGHTETDEYQESGLYTATPTSLPSHTFTGLNSGTTYELRAELYIGANFYGYATYELTTAATTPAAWTWTDNNGSWTVRRVGRETYTVESKAALDGVDEGRRTQFFHAEVWNDMCEKVRDMLRYLGEEWDTEYLPYDQTIMNNTWGYQLTSVRYRSLWTQVLNHINTSGLNYAKFAQGQNVYASYILDLMSYVNSWISSAATAYYFREDDDYLAPIIARWTTGATLTNDEITRNTNRNTAIDNGTQKGRKFSTDALTEWLDLKKG